MTLPLYLRNQAPLYRLEKAKRQTLAQKPHAAVYGSEDGIVAFANDVLGIRLADYQEDIVRHFVTHKRVAVRGPHGLGKTTIAAVCTLWLIAVHDTDVKVATTASAWRQLTLYLWPEIRKWASQADWSKVGLELRRNKELLDMHIKLPNKEAFAVASDNPALIEGAHASVMGYIFDESKAIPPDIFDAAEGAFSTGVAYALAISTPGPTAGRFYDIHQRKPGYSDWWVRHVTVEEAIVAGRINPAWVEARKLQWGEHSAIYQNRVLGEFAANSDESVIPLTWVEQAVERWYACNGKGDGKVAYGVDVARFGDDKTVIVRQCGQVVESIQYHIKQDTMQTVGHVIQAVPDQQTPIAVDVIGIGAGVVDRLRELEYNVQAVNVAESTDQKDSSLELKFVNLRSQIWWALREALDPQGGIKLAIPPDDLLIGDLTAPQWEVNSSGKIKVESKDSIKSRLGRSPDSADGVGLAYHASVTPDWIFYDGEFH